MVEISDDLAVVLISIAVVCGILLLCLIVWLILRHAPCVGPDSLSQGDATALATFQELYRLEKLTPRAPEEYFQVKKKKWLRVRDYIELDTPITHWADLFEGQVTGFLVPAARRIDGVLHDFQLRMWERHGDFIEHWPVMLVAQEWRLWAMSSLQILDRPTQEGRTEVLFRLRWIESARNLRMREILNLRRTKGWDDNDKQSLLICLRDWVRPELEEIIDRWDSYELQLTFGDQLRELKVLLEQNVASSLRFVEVVLDTEDVRLTSCFWGVDFCNRPGGHRDPYLEALMNRVRQLLRDNFGKALSGLGASDSEVPSGGGPTAPKALDKEEKAQWYRQWKIRKAKDYGMSDKDLRKLLTGYVLMHRAIEAVATSVVLIRRVSRFAQLGGELFLSKALNKDHLMELLEFVLRVLVESGDRIEDVGDQVQRGWETIRRGSTSSSWSSSGPLDNLRLALSAKADVVKTVREGITIARELSARADKSAAQKVEDDLNAELESYLAEWKSVKEQYAQVLADEDVIIDVDDDVV